MRKIIFYRPMTLDAYYTSPENDYSFMIDFITEEVIADHDKFIETVDTTVCTEDAYEELLAMNKNKHPYPKLKNFVITDKLINIEGITSIAERDVILFMKDLRAKEGKDIYLIGNQELFGKLLDIEIIDQIDIIIYPALIAKGKEYWTNVEKLKYLRPLHTKTIGKVLKVTYGR